MTNIEYELFRQIMIELNNIMSFEEFCAAHEHISAPSLRNYAYKNMKPTPKKFYYVLDCLKRYHSKEYNLIIDRIEARENKSIENMIKDEMKERIEAITRNDIVFYNDVG